MRGRGSCRLLQRREWKRAAERREEDLRRYDCEGKEEEEEEIESEREWMRGRRRDLSGEDETEHRN